MIYLDVGTTLGTNTSDQRLDTLEAAADVADIVGTYADLENYDTSALTDNAVINVLSDSTHGNAQTYYRYSKSDDSFTFIDAIGPYVDLTTAVNKVYGTDSSGKQTTYDYNSFGKVEDVKVNNVSVVENKVANIEPVAEDVKYTNPAVTSITNIQEALDDLLNIHYYVNPAYSKFTIADAHSYDVGDTATNPFTIAWDLNKQPKAGDTQTLSLDNTKIYDIMANSESSWKSGSYEYNTKDFTATSPKTFTFKIEYTDNHSTVPGGKTNKCNATKSFSFMYRRFWGVTDTETLTDEQIWAMSNELSTTRTQTRDFNCSGGKYWWIIIPTTYCSNISFIDVASGLPMTLPDSCINTRTIKNNFNVSYSVNTYRVEYKQTASSVKVKVN